MYVDDRDDCLPASMLNDHGADEHAHDPYSEECCCHARYNNMLANQASAVVFLIG